MGPWTGWLGCSGQSWPPVPGKAGTNARGREVNFWDSLFHMGPSQRAGTQREAGCHCWWDIWGLCREDCKGPGGAGAPVHVGSLECTASVGPVTRLITGQPRARVVEGPRVLGPSLGPVPTKCHRTHMSGGPLHPAGCHLRGFPSCVGLWAHVVSDSITLRFRNIGRSLPRVCGLAAVPAHLPLEPLGNNAGNKNLSVVFSGED